MTALSYIDRYDFSEKSYPLRCADMCLTPLRVAFGGRHFDSDKKILSDVKIYPLALRIFAGMGALVLFPLTLAALAVKWLKREEWQQIELDQSEQEEVLLEQEKILDDEVVEASPSIDPTLAQDVFSQNEIDVAHVQLQKAFEGTEINPETLPAYPIVLDPNHPQPLREKMDHPIMLGKHINGLPFVVVKIDCDVPQESRKLLMDPFRSEVKKNPHFERLLFLISQDLMPYIAPMRFSCKELGFDLNQDQQAQLEAVQANFRKLSLMEITVPDFYCFIEQPVDIVSFRKILNQHSFEENTRKWVWKIPPG